MKEILPKELLNISFDGERIGNMSKEIEKVRVKNLPKQLGLLGFTTALDHLKGRSKALLFVVMMSYDSKSDSRLPNTKRIEDATRKSRY